MAGSLKVTGSVTGELSETGIGTLAASGNGSEMTTEAGESIVTVSVERSTGGIEDTGAVASA